MLGYTYLDIMPCLRCYGSPVGYEAYNARIHLYCYAYDAMAHLRGMRPRMLGYTYLDIMPYLRCYGSPEGYEADDARMHLSKYNAMPKMLRPTCRV